MRICVLSERLRRPFDEGIKNVAVGLIRALAVDHDVLALTCGGLDDAELGIRNVDANRLFFNAELWSAVRRFAPQAVVYVPTACGTVFSFLRARVLRFYGRGSWTALVTLQPRPYTAWGKRLVGGLAPDLVLAQSKRTVDLLSSLGCRTALLPAAVDTRRFRPASPDERAALRGKYGIPVGATVVVHVGHLKGKRSLACLASLRSAGDYYPLVVGSTSTTQEVSLKQALRGQGVAVIDTYVTEIEDIYRLSDVYVFLAKEDTAAIEVPLSVLEAMACNLRVVCTRFGGLPDLFGEGDGLYYLDERSQLLDAIVTAVSAPCATREMVGSRTWSVAAQAVVDLAQVSAESL